MSISFYPAFSPQAMQRIAPPGYHVSQPFSSLHPAPFRPLNNGFHPEPMAEALPKTQPKAKPVPQNRIVALFRNPKAQEMGMLAFTAIAIPALKTWMHLKANQHAGLSLSQRRLLHQQEWIRQTVSTALWLGTSLATYVLLDNVFPSQSAVGRFLTSNLISSIPDTFIRPFVTARILKFVLANKKLMP